MSTLLPGLYRCKFSPVWRAISSFMGHFAATYPTHLWRAWWPSLVQTQQTTCVVRQQSDRGIQPQDFWFSQGIDASESHLGLFGLAMASLVADTIAVPRDVTSKHPAVCSVPRQLPASSGSIFDTVTESHERHILLPTPSQVPGSALAASWVCTDHRTFNEQLWKAMADHEVRYVDVCS